MIRKRQSNSDRVDGRLAAVECAFVNLVDLLSEDDKAGLKNRLKKEAELELGNSDFEEGFKACMKLLLD